MRETIELQKTLLGTIAKMRESVSSEERITILLHSGLPERYFAALVPLALWNLIDDSFHLRVTTNYNRLYRLKVYAERMTPTEEDSPLLRRMFEIRQAFITPVSMPYPPGATVQLFRGMCEEEYRRIVAGDFDQAGVSWTPDRDLAEHYARNSYNNLNGTEGIVCGVYVDAQLIRHYIVTPFGRDCGLLLEDAPPHTRIAHTDFRYHEQ